MARSKEAALRALELAPELGDAHKVMGMVQMFWDWDWAGAERSFRRALELSPGSADVHYRFAWMLAVRGRFEEALAECRRAQEIDPLSVDVSVFLGRIYLFARDPDRAIAQFRRTLELDPNAFWAHYFLAVAYEHKGLYENAVQEWQKVLALSDVPAERVAAVMDIYRREGYPGLLRRQIELWTSATAGREQDSSTVALRYAALGDKEQSLRWLERSFDSHTRDLVYLKVEPGYDPLRSDPRFQEMLRRVHLAD